MLAPPSCPVTLPAICTLFGQSIVSRPCAWVAVCELTASCRLPHCDRLPGSVMRDPRLVCDTHAPISENGALALVLVDVLTEVADGVVGISTVLCRSELQAVASATAASSASNETVLFTMVVVVRLHFCSRTHISGVLGLPNTSFS